MVDPYASNIVKKYQYWTVYVNEDQGFIGRCVVWCNREDALDLADATPEEQRELFQVLHDIREATRVAFGAAWFNYSFLGNTDRHLHCHFFPRYQEPVIFNDITFADGDFNAQPSKTGTTNLVSKETLELIRVKLAEALQH